MQNQRNESIELWQQVAPRQANFINEQTKGDQTWGSIEGQERKTAVSGIIVSWGKALWPREADRGAEMGLFSSELAVIGKRSWCMHKAASGDENGLWNTSFTVPSHILYPQIKHANCFFGRQKEGKKFLSSKYFRRENTASCSRAGEQIKTLRLLAVGHGRHSWYPTQFEEHSWVAQPQQDWVFSWLSRCCWLNWTSQPSFSCWIGSQ